MVLVGSAAVVGRAAPAAGQAGAAELSPEEAVSRLAPYLLTPADLPGDFQIGRVGAATAVTFGFDRDDPLAAFRQNSQAGLIVFVQQTIVPNDLFALLSIDSLDLYLLRDASSAHGVAVGDALPPTAGSGVVFSPVDLGLKLGDTTTTWRAEPGSAPFGRTVSYAIRWQRDRLVFELDATRDPRGATPRQLAALAQSIGEREAALGSPDLATPAVPAPATEEMRAAALQQLIALDIPAALAPPGFRAPTRSVTSAANIVAGNLDRSEIVQRVDLQWKRLIEADEYFQSASSAARVAISIAQDADAGGAVTDERDLLLLPGEGFVVTDAPISLGETTFAFRTGYDSAGGVVTESQALEWTHGALLLAVSMSGPPGSTRTDDLVAFARLLEAQYQASAFASTAAAFR